VKPLLSKKKLLVSVAAGIKLKDLEVCQIECFFTLFKIQVIGLFESQYSKLYVGVIIYYLHFTGRAKMEIVILSL